MPRKYRRRKRQNKSSGQVRREKGGREKGGREKLYVTRKKGTRQFLLSA
jgi:hypothetical protein